MLSFLGWIFTSITVGISSLFGVNPGTQAAVSTTSSASVSQSASTATQKTNAVVSTSAIKPSSVTQAGIVTNEATAVQTPAAVSTTSAPVIVSTKVTTNPATQSTASSYILLTATWSNPALGPLAFVVTRPDGTVIPQTNFASNNIVIVPALSTAYTETVAVANPGSTTGWKLGVSNSTGLGNVVSNIQVPSVTPVAQGFSLQNVNNGILTATLSFSGMGADSSVSFSADQDGKNFDGMPLMPSSFSNSTGTMSLKDLNDGHWYIYAIIQNGGSPPIQKYSSNSLEVSGNTITIVSP